MISGTNKKKQKEIYQLNSDLNIITPTKKKPMFRLLKILRSEYLSVSGY